MNEWEIKYRTLLMGIDNPVYIENAERLARLAIQMAATTPHTLEEVAWMLMSFANKQMSLDWLHSVNVKDEI
jgi:hypothetical protein